MKRAILAGTVGVVAGFIAGAAAIINYEVKKEEEEKQRILDCANKEFEEQDRANSQK